MSIEKGKRVIQQVVEGQNELNKVVDADWVEKGRDWPRAIWTEAGEAMAYLPWPWWKGGDKKGFASSKHRYQFYLELADMFCFGVSQTIQEAWDNHLPAYLSAASDLIWHHYQLTPTDKPSELLPEQYLEAIARNALNGRSFHSGALFMAADVCGLGREGLIAYFHAKDTLNHFRQKNGYKVGAYIRNWGTEKEPEDDNIYLAKIVEAYQNMHKGNMLDRIQSGDFVSHVRRNLSSGYTAVLQR